MTLELSDKEQVLLVQVLERELAELPSEVRRTQTSTYREELKAEEHVLRELCNRLRNPGRHAGA